MWAGGVEMLASSLRTSHMGSCISHDQTPHTTALKRKREESSQQWDHVVVKSEPPAPSSEALPQNEGQAEVWSSTPCLVPASAATQLQVGLTTFPPQSTAVLASSLAQQSGGVASAQDRLLQTGSVLHIRPSVLVKTEPSIPDAHSMFKLARTEAYHPMPAHHKPVSTQQPGSGTSASATASQMAPGNPVAEPQISSTPGTPQCLTNDLAMAPEATGTLLGDSPAGVQALKPVFFPGTITAPITKVQLTSSSTQHREHSEVSRFVTMFRNEGLTPTYRSPVSGTFTTDISKSYPRPLTASVASAELPPGPIGKPGGANQHGVRAPGFPAGTSSTQSRSAYIPGFSQSWDPKRTLDSLEALLPSSQPHWGQHVMQGTLGVITTLPTGGLPFATHHMGPPTTSSPEVSLGPPSVSAVSDGSLPLATFRQPSLLAGSPPSVHTVMGPAGFLGVHPVVHEGVHGPAVPSTRPQGAWWLPHSYPVHPAAMPPGPHVLVPGSAPVKRPTEERPIRDPDREVLLLEQVKDRLERLGRDTNGWRVRVMLRRGGRCTHHRDKYIYTPEENGLMLRSWRDFERALELGYLDQPKTWRGYRIIQQLVQPSPPSSSALGPGSAGGLLLGPEGPVPPVRRAEHSRGPLGILDVMVGSRAAAVEASCTEAGLASQAPEASPSSQVADHPEVDIMTTSFGLGAPPLTCQLDPLEFSSFVGEDVWQHAVSSAPSGCPPSTLAVDPVASPRGPDAVTGREVALSAYGPSSTEAPATPTCPTQPPAALASPSQRTSPTPPSDLVAVLSSRPPSIEPNPLGPFTTALGLNMETGPEDMPLWLSEGEEPVGREEGTQRDHWPASEVQMGAPAGVGGSAVAVKGEPSEPEASGVLCTPLLQGLVPHGTGQGEEVGLQPAHSGEEAVCEPAHGGITIKEEPLCGPTGFVHDLIREGYIMADDDEVGGTCFQPFFVDECKDEGMMHLGPSGATDFWGQLTDTSAATSHWDGGHALPGVVDMDESWWAEEAIPDEAGAWAAPSQHGMWDPLCCTSVYGVPGWLNG